MITVWAAIAALLLGSFVGYATGFAVGRTWGEDDAPEVQP